MGYARGYQSVGVGDPFVHKKIGSALGAIAGFLPRPLGKFVELASQTTFFSPSTTTIRQTVPTPVAFPGGFTGQPLQQTGKGGGGGTTTTTTTTAGAVSGTKKRRRMNVLNVKALRRSTRRLAGFQREAKKVEKELRKLAPQSRSRSRRDLGPHHTHVR